MAKPKQTPAQKENPLLQANDIQVGGQHYKSAFQHWEFVNVVLEGRYMEGQITKYVSRWNKKNGVQDLQKAEHFLNKLLEQEAAGRVAPITPGAEDAEGIALFCKSNEVAPLEALIIVVVSSWRNRDDLLYALRTLSYLTAALEPK
jgi:hypothetical protein